MEHSIGRSHAFFDCYGAVENAPRAIFDCYGAVVGAIANHHDCYRAVESRSHTIATAGEQSIPEGAQSRLLWSSRFLIAQDHDCYRAVTGKAALR